MRFIPTNSVQKILTTLFAMAVVVGPSHAQNERSLLSNTRQLTFDGRRAGEGYFGADGKSMVFQSERDPANPFFQIFKLDFELGDVTRISPGSGKTTCAWLHPDGQSVLFSSTHDDPQAVAKQKQEIEFRESGQNRRYSWDYDENYELYAFDVKKRQYQRLTHAVGYDAEGSYSPNGKLIAFASNRNAYTGALTDEQKKKFEVDPAYMMDIFVMNADGSNLRQLTDVPGYDGGPFFSPDGKRICWRRFAENGATAEIMTMNLDGSDARTITRLGKLSWAPFYHPSGKYIVFTTNRHGFGNFELYLVDVDGLRPPVRITNTPGFDGLASFSPDGKQLTWTSNRNEKKQSQIYLADWNHQAALELLQLKSPPVTPEESAAADAGNRSANETSLGFAPEDIGRHVDFFCRRELGGRLTGSIGEHQATAYVAAYLDSLGVKAAGENGTWYQSFEFPAGVELGDRNSLTFNTENSGASYPLSKAWLPLSFSANGTFDSAKIKFVGYGIEAPETEQQPAYSSYQDLDVTDSWVMMLRYLPDDVTEQRRAFLAKFSSLRKKVMVARDRGAKGVIIVSGPRSNVQQQLVPLVGGFANSSTSIAAISITDEVAANWLNGSGKDLNQLQEQLDQGLNLKGFQCSGQIEAEIEVKHLTGTGRNVVGRLLAGETASDGAVVVCAHIDHLGKGGSGSLAKSDQKGQIHVGADDNASGVAAMLEVAEFLAAAKHQGKLTMERDIIFAAWSGEELGLFGSKHYVDQFLPDATDRELLDKDLQPYTGDPHDINQLRRYYESFVVAFDPTRYNKPQLTLMEENLANMRIVVQLLSSPGVNDRDENKQTVAQIKAVIAQSESKIKLAQQQPPVDSQATDAAVSACINMDMVGRMRDKVVLQGLGSSDDWNRLIEKANVAVGLPIETSDDTQLPTDASSFYRAGVPILSAFTGSHTDYHTPGDTPEKLNYPAAAKIARLMGLITRQLAMTEDSPKYKKHNPSTVKRIASAGRRARLGTIPNYTENVVGVLLDGVDQSGPAFAAGVRGGDVIVELAGTKIENIHDYQNVIDLLKVGKKTEITVIRKGERLTLEITPGSRE